MNRELNLTATLSPIGLLECRRLLRAAAPDDVIRVIVNDPQMADDLVKIVDLSEDRIDSVACKKSLFYITIRKSPSTAVKEEKCS